MLTFNEAGHNSSAILHHHLQIALDGLNWLSISVCVCTSERERERERRKRPEKGVRSLCGDLPRVDIHILLRMTVLSHESGGIGLHDHVCRPAVSPWSPKAKSLVGETSNCTLPTPTLHLTSAVVSPPPPPPPSPPSLGVSWEPACL